MDVKQLIDLIKSTNIKELSNLRSKVKYHMSGKLSNELLNYNNEVLEWLEKKYWDLDSIESGESVKNLFIAGCYEYFIGENLKIFLQKGYKLSNETKNKIIPSYVYMVIFNIIKKGDKYILIYNYIEYNEIFLSILYLYVLLEQRSRIIEYGPGYVSSDYFFIIDNFLIDKNPYLLNIYNKVNKNFPFFMSRLITPIYWAKLHTEGNVVSLGGWL